MEANTITVIAVYTMRLYSYYRQTHHYVPSEDEVLGCNDITPAVKAS